MLCSLLPLPLPLGHQNIPDGFIDCTLLPPKYTISHPQCTQQRAHPPTCHICHCCHLFTSAPYPLLNTPPHYTPLPSHPAPSAYPIPYPLTQKTLFVILTSPGFPAYNGLLCFLGGGISPIYINHV